MNYKLIVRILGRIMLVEAAFMAPALGISGYLGETEAVGGFALTMLLLFTIGTAVTLREPARRRFYAREGFVTVGLGWIVVSFFGALPFYFSGAIPSLADSVFEAISGFTTTGATILKDVEALPLGILYWRSFTHWLGGMGVLVFVLAIGPMSREAGYSMHLLRAESPGPEPGKLVPRMQRSALILYKIYIALTLAEIVALLLTGLNPLDSVTISFATLGTGGFTMRNSSAATYPQAAQAIIMVFMILSGMNFNMFYLILLRQYKKVLKNTELRAYLVVIVCSVVLVAINSYSMFGSVWEALHHSAFQTAAIITTAGFSTISFELWPAFTKTLLIFLMIIGSCSGSTGGGIKIVRAMILLKSVKRTIYNVLRPNQVQATHLGGEALTPETVNRVESFVVVYMIIFIASVLLVSADGFSVDSSFMAVITCINNIGPGIIVVGTVDSFTVFSLFGKFVLCLDMLLGRLELFPIIILFTPSVWKK